MTLFALLPLGACAACAPPEFPRCEEEGALPALDVDPTWHEHVRPIVEGRCARCHTPGGVGPFPLETREDVVDNADGVREAVASRLMPPWMPARCCREYKHDSSLTPEQIATVTRWIDDGMPEGDVARAGEPLPPVAGLPRVDLELSMAEPYQPAPAAGAEDDFRCFVVEWPLEEEIFVTGFDLLPGARDQLHHAIVFVAAPDQVQGFLDEDARADGPGWPCPGGFVYGVSSYLGGWGPGRDGQVTPAEHGHEVVPGSALLFAMHYARHDGEPLVEDQSTIQLVLDDDVESTLRSVWAYNGLWPSGLMHIPRGEPDVRHAVYFDATDYYSSGAPITVFSAAFHMHEHGTRGLLGVRRADGTDECLLQIDEWDADWQTDHEFVEPVVLERGDQLFIECFFDGHPERDMNWSEGGEMCVAFLTAAGEPR